MKLTSLPPFPPARFALASLLVLSAGACLAAGPAPDPAPEVKTTDDVTVIKRGNTVININGYSASARPKIWCGVTLTEMPAEVRAQLPLEEGAGVLVRNVVTASPAQKAGVQVHDVLTKFDGQKISDSLQFSQLVAARKEGDVVRLTYFRHGREEVAEVTLGQPPAEEASKIALQTLRDWKKNLPDDGAFAAGNSDTLAQVEKALQAQGWNAKAIEQTKKDVANALLEAQKALRIEVKQD